MRTRRKPVSRQGARGYALLAALVLLIIATLGVVAAVGRAQLDAQRQKEQELLFAGDAYRQALIAYATAPGVPRQFPLRLDDLLEDRRFESIRRHLRRLYPDPMTGKADWDLILAGGRIVGVRSRIERPPLLHAGFALADAGFAQAQSYRDWAFAAVAVASAAGAAGSGSAINTQANTDLPGSLIQIGSGNDASAPRDPLADRKAQCYNDFQEPKSHCQEVPPPIGESAQSCIRTYTLLYGQCMAAIGGP